MKLEVICIITLIIISIATGTLEVVFHNTNELMSTIATCVQAICIVIQCILLFKQLKLSETIEEKTRAENKGIFILDRTNIVGENEEYTNNKYDLNKEISFHNKGNDHVILKAVCINGIMKGDGYRTFFTNLEQYSKLLIDLELSKEELEEKIIELKIDLELENLKGYNYVENIEIVFKKDNDENVYNLELFNIRIN
jgi:hypothetical protein